jgi:arylsulfatase A-like enzyme
LKAAHARRWPARVNEEVTLQLSPLESTKPLFLYVHYMDPHAPYEAPAAFREIFSDSEPIEGYPPTLQQELREYDASIRYLDSQLADLFDLLRAREIERPSVIIVVGDHGEQFQERGKRWHGNDVYQEEIHVPLIVKAQERTGSVQEIVSLTRIFPTILELTGSESTSPPRSAYTVGSLRPRRRRRSLL